MNASPWTLRMPAALVLSCAIAQAIAAAAPAARVGQDTSHGLPPPPREALAPYEAVVYLELVVNGQPSGKVAPVLMRQGHYLVEPAALPMLGDHLQDAVQDDGRVAVDALPGVRVDYDTARLRLMIDVPAAWLPEQRLGGQGATRYPALGSTGLMLNYDLFGTSPRHGSTQASAWSELRLFGSRGVLSSTGVWRAGGRQAHGYARYDTRWWYADEERMLTWEAGDLVTRGTAWGSAVRMGGFQLSRDFSLRPDVVTYPLPQFAGEAAVPSAVDLFVDGYRASRGNVEPGPFTLANAPFVNGAGEAVIVVTDALGRQVSTSVPFYVSSDLLRPGLSDVAVGVGAIRRDYGLRDFAYGSLGAHGTWRYGLTDWLTLETHGEAASSFGQAGVGGVLRIGRAGVLNAAYGGSRNDGRVGRQATVGYQYTARRFNVSAQRSHRSDGFADLAVHDRPTMLLARRTSTSVAGSVSLDAWGSVGMGYFDVKSTRAERTRLLNLSWSTSPWRDVHLYLSGNREVGGDDWSAILQLVVTLGRNQGTVSTSIERHGDGADQQRVSYTRSVPSQGGFGWNLGYAHTEGAEGYRQADLAWRNEHVQLRGGLYGASGDTTRWGEASGALVLMDGAVFASNQINDAFVVVDTQGQAGIPVRYENQRVGVTDAGGHLLVPWASAYYGAKYEIDPLQLPAYVQVPQVEQRVAVRRGGGYLLRFPVERVVAANVVLHGADGGPLPVASVVSTADGRQALVGWDGLVYLEGLQARNTLSVRLPDGGSCSTQFALDTTLEQVAKVGPLVCR